MELIDRNALMKKICGNECGSVCDEECENVACNFYDYIMDAPTIEAEPVRNGQWIKDHTDLICSVCKWKYSDELPFMSNHGLDSMTEAFARCPHCGAKMYADGGTISKERFAEIMRGAGNG